MTPTPTEERVNRCRRVWRQHPLADGHLKRKRKTRQEEKRDTFRVQDRMQLESKQTNKTRYPFNWRQRRRKCAQARPPPTGDAADDVDENNRQLYGTVIRHEFRRLTSIPVEKRSKKFRNGTGGCCISRDRRCGFGLTRRSPRRSRCGLGLARAVP